MEGEGDFHEKFGQANEKIVAGNKKVDQELETYRLMSPENKQKMLEDYRKRFENSGQDTTQWTIEDYVRKSVADETMKEV